MPFMNYKGLTYKANIILCTWKDQKKQLDDVAASIRYQELNLKALYERQARIKRLVDVAEELFAKLPPVEAQVLREKLDHPGQSAAFYAESVKVPRESYFTLYKKTCKDVEDLLAKVEGWEDL